jgi:hypothetical protein
LIGDSDQIAAAEVAAAIASIGAIPRRTISASSGPECPSGIRPTYPSQGDFSHPFSGVREHGLDDGSNHFHFLPKIRRVKIRFNAIFSMTMRVT